METADTQELDQQQTVDTDAEVPNTEHEADAATEAQTATSGEGASEEGVQGEDGELQIQFGDEAPPASDDQGHEDAPQWVKEVRERNRELARRNRELEAAAQQQPTQQPAVPTLGPKPKLEEFDYDEGKFDEALGKWYADKTKVDAAEAEQRSAEEARQRAIQERRSAYATEATQLRAKDFQDVETEVVGALSPIQQGILLAGADKPATLVYALGRYPTKLRDLAKITDPVRFAFAAGKLEKELKVTSRTKTKPAPEGRVSSNTGAPNVDANGKKLEQLRDEAAKTGDLSKVIAYKKQMKERQR